MNSVSQYAKFLFALVLLANFSNALGLEPESTSITSCICETTLVKIVASNPSDAIESVLMSSAGDKAWIIPGPKEFNLLPRSSKEITAFVTPDCFAVPGKYSGTVTAKTTSSSATTKIGIDVSACVKMEQAQSIGLCRGEVLKTKMPISNIARDEGRTYVLTASSKDAPASALTMPPKIYVDVNSEKEFEYPIDSAKLSVGTYNFDIKAQALYEATDVPTTDVGVTKLKVEVKNCEAYEMQLPESVDVCARVPTTVNMKLVNKGAPADIKLTSDADYITMKPSAGLLHYQETAPIEISINAPKGTMSAKIIGKSELKSVEKILKINARECFGTELQMQSEKVICSEEGAEYYLTIKNRETPAEYQLSVNGIGAKLAVDKVSLGKMESKTVKVTIPKDSDTGSFLATFTATSKDGKDSITKDIAIQKCYDFRLTGPEVELCPCEETSTDFELINFGIKDDTYMLESESGFLTLKDSKIDIKSKEKAKLSARINSCELQPGKYSGIISAKSGTFTTAEDKLKIDLTVKSKEQCYGIELVPATTNIVSECGIKGTVVKVINKGTKETAVSLSANQGSKVTPDNLLLQAGESKEVNLVVFPSPSRCGTSFSVDMKAESKGVAITKQFSVKMAPEEKATATPVTTVPPKATEKASEVKELTANIEYENDTLLVKSIPGTKVLISGENAKTLEENTNEKGELQTRLGAGTFLITLSRPGYKPVTLQVNVTGNQTGMGVGAAAGNLGTIPLLLVAFLIIVAALYFVLRKSDSKEGSEEEEPEEVEEEPAEEKPKRGRKRK